MDSPYFLVFPEQGIDSRLNLVKNVLELAEQLEVFVCDIASRIVALATRTRVYSMPITPAGGGLCRPSSASVRSRNIDDGRLRPA
jgi:hypothetical protein